MQVALLSAEDSATLVMQHTVWISGSKLCTYQERDAAQFRWNPEKN